MKQISRAFGDIEAKMPKFGGNPNVLVSHPEITSFSVDSEHDFVILGCIIHLFLRIITFQ